MAFLATGVARLAVPEIAARLAVPEIASRLGPGIAKTTGPEIAKTTGTVTNKPGGIFSTLSRSRVPTRKQTGTGDFFGRRPQTPTPNRQSAMQSTSQSAGQQSRPQSGQQSRPQSVPQSVPQSGPQSGQQSVPQSGPQSGQQSRPQSGQQSGQQSRPQSVPQSGPQSGQQSVPHSVPQSGQQSGQQSRPQSVPQSGPQSVPQSGQQSMQPAVGIPVGQQSMQPAVGIPVGQPHDVYQYEQGVSIGIPTKFSIEQYIQPVTDPSKLMPMNYSPPEYDPVTKPQSEYNPVTKPLYMTPSREWNRFRDLFTSSVTTSTDAIPPLQLQDGNVPPGYTSTGRRQSAWHPSQWKKPRNPITRAHVSSLKLFITNHKITVYVMIIVLCIFIYYILDKYDTTDTKS